AQLEQDAVILANLGGHTGALWSCFRVVAITRHAAGPEPGGPPARAVQSLPAGSGFAQTGLCGDFRGEVHHFFLDAFAYHEADETGYAGIPLLEQLVDLDVRVLDEGLFGQADFLDELAQTATDHLFDDVGR